MTDIRDILFAFSEEVRLRAALLLEGSTLCVNCLVKVVGMPQSTVSRHLSILRRTGVVRIRKEGLHSYYTLNKQGAEGKLIKGLVRTYGGSLLDTEPFSGDLKRLLRLAEECAADCKIRTRTGRITHGKVQ